jgi:hypothetical protein
MAFSASAYRSEPLGEQDKAMNSQNLGEFVEVVRIEVETRRRNQVRSANF